MNGCKPRNLSQNAFHLVQNHVNPPDEEHDVLWQQRCLVALSTPTVRRPPLSVGGHVLLRVLNGFFQGDGERQGDAGELDGQTGAARDVEVWKLTEGILEFEHANELRVEGANAGATRLRSPWSDSSWPWKREGGLTEDATAYVFEDRKYGVDAVVAEFEGWVEVADGFWEGRQDVR